jgi:hypothetical protein
MKITYLHGLESSQGGPKVEYLNLVFDDVYAPSIDYRKKGVFQHLLDGASDSSLIIGSSMGAWAGYNIATINGSDTILFNPAVHSRSIELDIIAGQKENVNRVVLGKQDGVIDPHKSIAWLKKNGIGVFNFSFYDGGHRVPLEIFKSVVSDYLVSIGCA